MLSRWSSLPYATYLAFWSLSEAAMRRCSHRSPQDYIILTLASSPRSVDGSSRRHTPRGNAYTRDTLLPSTVSFDCVALIVTPSSSISNSKNDRHRRIILHRASHHQRERCDHRHHLRRVCPSKRDDHLEVLFSLQRPCQLGGRISPDCFQVLVTHQPGATT